MKVIKLYLKFTNCLRLAWWNVKNKFHKFDIRKFEFQVVVPDRRERMACCSIQNTLYGVSVSITLYNCVALQPAITSRCPSDKQFIKTHVSWQERNTWFCNFFPIWISYINSSVVIGLLHICIHKMLWSSFNNKHLSRSW